MWRVFLLFSLCRKKNVNHVCLLARLYFQLKNLFIEKKEEKNFVYIVQVFPRLCTSLTIPASFDVVCAAFRIDKFLRFRDPC